MYFPAVTTILIIIGAGVIQLLSLTIDNGLLAWLFLTAIPASWVFIWARVCHWIKSVDMKRQLNFYFYLLLLVGPFATIGAFLNIFLFRSIFPIEKKESVKKNLKPLPELDTIYIDPDQEEGDKQLLRKEFTPDEKLEYGLTENYWSGGNEHYVDPFIDIMKGKDLNLKRSTIDKVIIHPGKYSRGILDMGLKDPSPDIQFYAASGLGLINKNFMDRFTRLKEKISKESLNIEYYLQLAKEYITYCNWGLPDKEDKKRYNEMIIECYTNVLKVAPHNYDALIGLSKVYLEENQPKIALKFLKEPILTKENPLEVFPLHLKALFNVKDFKELSKTIQRYSQFKEVKEHSLKNRDNINNIDLWKNLEKNNFIELDGKIEQYRVI